MIGAVFAHVKVKKAISLDRHFELREVQPSSIKLVTISRIEDNDKRNLAAICIVELCIGLIQI